MWLSRILIGTIFFASYARNGDFQEHKREKRFFFTGFLSKKRTSVLDDLGHFSSNGAPRPGDLGAGVINPIFSHAAEGLEKLGDGASTAIGKVVDKSSNLAGKSIEAVETIAEDISNAFSDHEINDLQKSFAHSMGLKPKKDVDFGRFRGLLKGLFDPSIKLLSTDRTYCGLCKLLIRGLQTNIFTIEKVGELICNIYITLSTLTLSDFCKSIIKVHKPTIKYIFDNSDILDPELACTILLQSRECRYEKPALQWVSKVPTTQPIIPKVTIDPNEKPLTFLHLTDFHISPDYEEGAVTNCGFPICCLKGLGSPLKGQKAGRWGDYNCDSPPWLLGDTLLHLNSTYKDVKVVYYTGDIPDHTVWKPSRETNLKLIYHVYRVLRETFPNAKIFPVIGNHEASPLNVFPPPDSSISKANLSNDWLYDLMAKVWRPWLSPKALETVKYQGYYAESVSPRLKIIGLNNNVCYNFNWWLFYNTTFLQEQLNFLTNELDQSEKIGQFVHILAHVSVGNRECIEPWEVSFNAIVQRYAHIIKGQFDGHTHTDEIKIFYDKSQKPINVAYNGGSLTTYVKYNPNYKVVFVQPSTMDVLDIETYYFNLTEANLHGNTSPAWKKLYSMKEAYSLTDLSPNSFDKFANKLLEDDSLQELYWRHYVRLGDASLQDGCDKDCKKEVTCKTVTTVSLQSAKLNCET